MTADAARKRAFWQIFLLSAGLLVLVAISATSVVLVNQARKDAGRVVHTIEVENQLATLLLEIRRAESAARAYLLNSQDSFLREHEAAVAVILPGVDQLAAVTSDNPVQVENMKRLRPAVMERMAEFARAVNFVKGNDTPSAIAMLPQTGAGPAVQAIAEAARAMRLEEQNLFIERTQKADRTQQLSSIVTVTGSALVILFAAGSLFLVRQSSNARDEAEAKLRDNNLNLESTVQERTADLREANEEIQRFAYIVSHDLRSPLVNVMGYTAEREQAGKTIDAQMTKVQTLAPDLVESDALTAVRDDIPEAVGFIRASTEKMDRLINAILKLSREGRRNLIPETIDMAAMAQKAADAIRHQTEAADAEVLVEPMPTFESDRLSIEQIVGNLIDNAVKYLDPKRPGRIVVSGQDRVGGWVEYTVSDNGRGISEKDHERIFELFRRAGRQDRPGEGLGLAFVRNSVRRLGGSIEVESVLGEGSTFRLKFPKRLILVDSGDAL